MPAADEHSAPAEDWSVRAYAITGGRVRSDVQLGFESMLRATPSGLTARPDLAFERASIIDLCTAEPLSVAELSARLHVPIGVIRVLAADLVSDELLQSFVASQNVADDVLLISRLISGVRSL